MLSYFPHLFDRKSLELFNGYGFVCYLFAFHSKYGVTRDILKVVTELLSNKTKLLLLLPILISGSAKKQWPLRHAMSFT